MPRRSVRESARPRIGCGRRCCYAAETAHERLRFPTIEELQARQQQALRTTFGIDAARLEEEWRRQLVTKASRG